MLFENNTTTQEAICDIPEPLWTNTWHPISHKVCDIIVNNTCDRLGLKINKRIYSASKYGKNVCCMLSIGNSNEVNPALFWRNSINKTFSFSLAIGTFTSMCSNGMIFGGKVQFQEFRRHTKKLDEMQLTDIVHKGIGTTLKRLDDVLHWHLSMEKIYLGGYAKSKELAYDAIFEGIISKLRIPEFNSLLYDENHVYDPYTLFGFHGACTQLYRDIRMGSRYAEMQKKLYNFVNNRFGDRLYRV